MTAQPTPDRRTLRAGDARLVVSPADGGRIASLEIGGRELLVTSSPLGPAYWGSYPMVPWAGRIRHGRFMYAGREHQLPLGAPPHALHGVVYDRPWGVVAAGDRDLELAIDLDDRWPFRARLSQRFELDEDGLQLTLALEAREPQPVVMGWHPWFRRSVEAGAALLELDFRPSAMLRRDADGIPSGELVPLPGGPWDDCFTGLVANPVLLWPGLLRLELASSCSWWVAYSKPEHAICVEPQSGPPDAVTLMPETVTPGQPMTHTMQWRWTRLDQG